MILKLESRKFYLTSTLEARNTQVGAMSTGSILFREYLQARKYIFHPKLLKPINCI